MFPLRFSRWRQDKWSGELLSPPDVDPLFGDEYGPRLQPEGFSEEHLAGLRVLAPRAEDVPKSGRRGRQRLLSHDALLSGGAIARFRRSYYMSGTPHPFRPTVAPSTASPFVPDEGNLLAWALPRSFSLEHPLSAEILEPEACRLVRDVVPFRHLLRSVTAGEKPPRHQKGASKVVGLRFRQHVGLEI